MSSLTRIFYVSAATTRLDGMSQDVSRIVMACTRFNKQNHVTGLLSFRCGCFMQILEGESAIVNALFAKISKDERHTRIQVLLRETVTERAFSTWVYRLAVRSEMPIQFHRFMRSAKAKVDQQATPEAREMLSYFYQAQPTTTKPPGTTFADENLEMCLEGTTPGLTRGLGSEQLDVVALLLQGWTTFKFLRRESGLTSDSLDALLLGFRERGLLKLRQLRPSAPTALSPPQPDQQTEGGFYATLRRFLLGS